LHASGLIDQIKLMVLNPKDDAKEYNTRSTTVRWLNNQTREVAEQRLWGPHGS